MRESDLSFLEEVCPKIFDNNLLSESSCEGSFVQAACVTASLVSLARWKKGAASFR